MTSSQPSQEPRPSLVRVPGEIFLLIYSYLSNRDIKNLRLVSLFFDRTAPLHLNRVFISANPRNIEVFEAISQHDVYRSRITEIVWDDALLASSPAEDEPDGTPLYEYIDYPENDLCFEWFRQSSLDQVRQWKRFSLVTWHKSGSPAREPQFGSPLMSLGDSWRYYQGLVRQQQEVMKTRAHIRALESRIGRFPALRKITVTSAHGRLFTPVYETPMIRAFPQRFNYPIPFWVPEDDIWGEHGQKWEAFWVVTDLLAQKLDTGNVTELCFKSFQHDFQHYWAEDSGPFMILHQTLSNLAMVLGRADFESLHLDLRAFQKHSEAASEGDRLNCESLKRVLASAAGGEGLKRLTLQGNCCDSLETICSPNSLQRMEHFGLFRFDITEESLLAFLATLPLSIRTIELDCVTIHKGSYQSLLTQIKGTLDWQNRVHRPVMSISSESCSVETDWGRQELSVWVEREVYSFLYEDGANPFHSTDEPKDGVGIVKDPFDSENQWPNLSYPDLERIGYVRNLEEDRAHREKD